MTRCELTLPALLAAFIVLLLCGCQRESAIQKSEKFELRVRLVNEPDRLNPILSRQPEATQIERRLFLALADYHPQTLELEPILIKEMPQITPVSMDLSKGLSYQFEILEDAKWDDQSPITGHDVAFTFKAACNPYLSNLSWRSHMEHISSIEIDSENEKIFTVKTDNQYILSEQVIATTTIYPEYMYDSSFILRAVTLDQIKDHNAELQPGADTILHSFADHFNNPTFSRNIISGAGPYKLVEWIPNQQIVLQRKQGWWAKKIQNRHPFLMANPETLIYYIIPDHQTAITALKDQRLDLVANLSAEHYVNLKEYNSTSKTLILETAPILQIFFIAINNDHPVLKHIEVRKALSHLVDNKNLREQLFFGLAMPVSGPIHPSNPFYNKELSTVEFNPDLAYEILTNDGWQKNSAGILQKSVEGQTVELKLDINTSRSQLSQDVAILLREEAEKIGVSISIIPTETHLLIKKVNEGDYDLATLATVQEIGPVDLYSNWHSINAVRNRSNYCKFKNEEADHVIEQLRTTFDESEQKILYMNLQKIIFEQRPAIFLVAPVTPIAALGKFDFKATVLRPGFLENTFTIQ